MAFCFVNHTGLIIHDCKWKKKSQSLLKVVGKLMGNSITSHFNIIIISLLCVCVCPLPVAEHCPRRSERTGKSPVAWWVGCFCWKSDPLPVQQHHTTCWIAAAAAADTKLSTSPETCSVLTALPVRCLCSAFCFSRALIGSSWQCRTCRESGSGWDEDRDYEYIYIFFCDDTKVHLTETSHCRYTLPEIIRPVSTHCKDDHNILYMYDCDNQRMGGRNSQNQTQRAEELTLQRLF